MLLNTLISTLGLLSLPSVYGAVHEQVTAAPAGWKLKSTSDAQSMTLSIALTQQNVDLLETMLMSVSTPGGAKYGKYLTADQVSSTFAPSNESVKAVMSWLDTEGVNAVARGSSIDVSTTVGKANSLLSAKFANYQDAKGVNKVRTLSYSIPDDIAEHVDFVSPATFFGRTSGSAARPITKRSAPNSVARSSLRGRSLAARQETPAQINSTCILTNDTGGYPTIGPECLKLIYNISYTPDAACGSTVGFGSFLNESASYSDLFQYEKTFGIPAQNFSVTLINGGTNDQNASTESDGEANLDVQNIIGISHPLPVTEFITGGSPPFIPNLDEPTAADNQNEPYLPYYEYLLAQPDGSLPGVISNSYGDDEQTVPEYYAKRVCNLIGMMGLRGYTILESSGDTGVGAACLSNNGKNSSQFTPIFPGTCPYITAVGGTQSLEPEIAWVGSSGGFSNYFPRPYYQVPAVEFYLNNEISNATKAYYNAFTNFSMRGFPDVSAHSLLPYYQVVQDGSVTASGGTSAASPVWAGVVALLNDARLRAGQPLMGFLNPFIYSVGYKGLTDITTGGSTGCNGINDQTGANVTGGGIIPFASWNATVGWDPVTGYGVPNFGKLVEIALNA